MRAPDQALRGTSKQKNMSVGVSRPGVDKGRKGIGGCESNQDALSNRERTNLINDKDKSVVSYLFYATPGAGGGFK